MESAAARDAPAQECPSRGARSHPYLPLRPQASPLYRVLADHFAGLDVAGAWAVVRVVVLR